MYVVVFNGRAVGPFSRAGACSYNNTYYSGNGNIVSLRGP